MKLTATGLALALSLLACTPAEPVATETGSTTSSTTTGTGTNSTTRGDASTAAPTTGDGACTPPDGDALDVLVLADGTLVIRPGSLACGGPPKSCDCVQEAIDRVVITLGFIGEGLHEFVDGSEANVQLQCAKGDDGCATLDAIGSVEITRADPGCVAGWVNFGAAALGSFAVAPCPG